MSRSCKNKLDFFNNLDSHTHKENDAEQSGMIDEHTDKSNKYIQKMMLNNRKWIPRTQKRLHKQIIKEGKTIKKNCNYK